MPEIPAPVVVTEVQRRHERLLHQLHDRIRRSARAVAPLRRKIADATAAIDDLRKRHPDFFEADIRERLRYVRLIVGLVAAGVLDALLAGRAGEHLLRTHLGVAVESAVVLRYLLPVALVLAEMAIALLRTRADMGGPSWWLWNAVAVLLLISMPLIVGETELASKGGLLHAQPTMFAITMMLLSLCVHGFVLFSGEAQNDALAFAWFSARTSSLNRSKRAWSESARLRTNAVGDLFHEWYRQRGLFVDRYPQARLPQPNWDPETREVVNGALQYVAIEPPGPAAPPNVAPAPAPAAGPGAGGQSTPPPGPQPSPAGPAPADGPPPSAGDLRDAYERRVRESEAEVTPD
jgi:hypothetical protein